MDGTLTMSSLASSQQTFTRCIRDPEHNPCPLGIDTHRLAVYQDLIYNNINSFLCASFPVLYELLSAAQWQKIVRDFICSHRCHTPYFLAISQEFLHYLQETHVPQTGDPPFMLELAHYEWVELALDTASDTIADIAVDSEGDLLAGSPVVSPLAWSLAYTFPVHRIGSSLQPKTPPAEKTYLVVYRDRQDKVGFMASNVMTARLLELLQSNSTQTGRDVLLQIAQEMSCDPQSILSMGLQTLLTLRKLDIILGVAC